MTTSTSSEQEAVPRHSRLVSSWAPLGVVALVPLFLLLGRGYQIGDPDTFWHIRAGDFLLQTWQFSGPDPWSPFTTNTWVLHEWLPELALSVANRVDGLAGVAWLWYVATVLVTIAFYASCRSQGRIVLSAIATVLALLGAAASLTPRPQLVTFALSAVVTAAWLSSAQDGRARWWLVPLTWVWACSHGMWFVSPLVGGAVVLGLALDRKRVKPVRRLGAVVVSSIVAAAITPAGPGLLLAPLSVSGYTRFVSEWDPPRLSSPPVAVTLFLLVVVAAIWVRSGRTVSWAFVFVWIIALGWALVYTRTVAVGAAMAAPLVVGVVSRALPRGQTETGAERITRRRVEWVTVVASAVIAAALAAVIIPPSTSAPDRMPVGFDVALDRLPAGTVVMDEYGLGGYLRYRHPDLVPVIDERTELYSVEYVEAYIAARGAEPGWTEFLRHTGERSPSCPLSRPSRTPSPGRWAGETWAAVAITYCSSHPAYPRPDDPESRVASGRTEATNVVGQGPAAIAR